MFDQVRHLPSFYSLVGAPPLRQVAAHIFGDGDLVAPFEKCQFRADRPDEDWSLLDWHQDYTYNMISDPSITFWLSLTPTTHDMGPVKLAPGTHRRIEPVKLVARTNLQGRAGVRPLHPEIDPDALERAGESFETGVGDVLLLHQLALHRSGRNRGARTRWSLQIRYGHLGCAAFRARGWRYETSGDFSLFRQIHPDLVSDG